MRRRSTKTAWKLGLILLLIGGPMGAATAQSNHLPPAETQATEDDALKLVEQLASPKFEVREQATVALLASGESALAALKSVPGEASFEVRQRCRLIEQQISARIFAEKSRQFLLDPDPTHDYQLPGWAHFRPLVGSTRTSKLMFLDMLEQDRPLVRLIVEVAEAESGTSQRHVRDERLAEVLVARAEELNTRLYSLTPPDIGEMVTVLFAASMTEAAPPIEVNRMLLNASQLSFQGYLLRPGYKDCLLRLVSAWLPRTHEAMAPETIRQAMTLDLPVVTPLARRHLAENFDLATRAIAFQYMAQYGEATDVPLLLAHIDDDTVVEEFSDINSEIAVAAVAPPGVPPMRQDEQAETLPSNRNRIVRISDLAVASAMFVLGEDPRSVFPRANPEKRVRLMLHELAVRPDEAAKQSAAARTWAQNILQQTPRS